MCASPYTGIIERETSTDTSDVFMSEEDALDTSETQTFTQQQQFVSADNNEFTCPSPVQPPKGKKRKNVASTDSRIDEAFDILKKSASNIELNQQSPDECTTYGTYIGNKLRNYTPKTKSFVQYYFNNILFEADMGRFDGNESNISSSLPTSYSNLPPTTHTSSQTSSPNFIYQNLPQAQPSTSNSVDFNPIFETSDGSSLESTYLG